MDPLIAFFLVIVALRLVALMLRAWATRRTEPAGVPRSHVDPCLGPVMAVPPTVRPVPAMPSEESLFVQLTSGAISREHYRGAMAELAARDEAQPQR